MRFHIRVDPLTGERFMAVPVKGKELLLDPFLYKGTAYTTRERVELDLIGLLPPAISTIKQQLERAYENFRAHPTSLSRHIFLTSLHDRNEVLFYRLLNEHIDEMIPIVYTPVVGEVCQKFSHLYRKNRGIYIAYEQKDEIEQILINSGLRNPSVIAVTDGERILGLGDQGAGGMGIPIGKLCLYTLCAGVSPYSTLPIMLDVGTDNEDRLKDPLYLGARHRRIRGAEYQHFIDAFVTAVQRVFPNVVLQWEDFLKGNAIYQLDRFKDALCTFNDDIQGTAGVVMAGLINALRITGRSMADQSVLLAGAGISAHGISNLIVTAMVEDGLSRAEATSRIYTVDSRGLVMRDRPGLEDFKTVYARNTAEVRDWDVHDRSHISLAEVVRHAKPTILLGTSGIPGIFTEKVIHLMSTINRHPIIFPLSNPTAKSECTPKEAILWSEGRAIIATRSPFAPVSYCGRRFRISQANNAFIFSGVGLGLTVSRSRRATDYMFLEAARALAAKVTDQDLEENAVYPQLSRIRECSHAVACAVIQEAVKEGFADEETLDHLEQRVDRAMWRPEYLPIHYEKEFMGQC